ncbi:HET-domain-containing protein, partial [Teratosphaeria nubilosa]
MDHPYIIGRAVPERPDIELCQEWIAKCSSEHAICAKIEDAALPTRLLDVGSGASTHPRLVFTNNLQKGRYAALSHCWGSTVTLCTTTENVARHAVCMPFDNLPLTFRHAVSVTRLLGLTYLWIDSLCILQDSPEDWQAECRRMEQIYENAAVVIAGPAAASSASGFYFSRPMSVIPPIRLPGNEHDDLLVGLSRVSSASERIPPTEKDSILTTRGWIVQERLLAQRVLYFGSHQFYMECDHTSHFESSWEAIDSRDDYTKGMVNCSRGKMALMRWYRTVEIYTACNITRATDRLPALAGLARRYAKLVQDTYLAGLWRNYVIHGLQWCLHGGPSGLRLGTHRGPSWSWASLDDPVSY